MFAITNLDNLNKDMNALSTETQKLNEISKSVESKVSSFLDKSKPKSDVSRANTTGWDPFKGIFPNGIDPKIIMAEVYERDPEMAKKIITKMSERTIEKRNTDPKDSMFQ